MKAAIVYYSMSGNTEYVAKKISENLDVDLIKLIPEKEYPNKGFRKFLWGGKSALMRDTPKLKTYEFDADNYDTIIFGTPVWASSFTPPIRTFIEENKTKLNNKKMAVFTCFMGTGADKTIEKLKQLLKINNFQGELVLVDPKDKASKEKDIEIEKFCKKIKNHI